MGFGALAIAPGARRGRPWLLRCLWWSWRRCCSSESQSGKVRGDAAVALISSGALAVGVLVISLTSGVNTNVSNYMFGSILTISARTRC